MKKIISTMLLIVVLFNFILCNNKTYAVEKPFEGTESINEVDRKSEYTYMNEGKTTDSSIGETSFNWDTLGSIFGTVASILVSVVNVFPRTIQAAITTMTIGRPDKSATIQKFTIEYTVFNQISLFDIDYFNMGESYSLAPITKDSRTSFVHYYQESSKIIRKNVAKYFIILRLIALSANLLVLIYVGIRMALSSISSDKAKYKKMLVDWLESMIILFLLQYIISAMFTVGSTFSNIIYETRSAMMINGEKSFELSIMETIDESLISLSGWSFVFYSVAYWVLVTLQIKFCLMYLKRFLTVGFLIVISPLITITYAIDKIGDGKAQGFSVFFSELMINIMIQPIHALIYLVFMYTANEIAKYSILISILFLLALTKVEKAVLKIFNLKNVVSLKPVSEESASLKK